MTDETPELDSIENTMVAVVATVGFAEFFKPGIANPAIAKIRALAATAAEGLDVSRPQDRKALASIAAKVARSKTFIEGKRKELVSEEKKRLKAIDDEARRIWDELENIQHDIRKPLTDWENIEKERVASHEFAIAVIAQLGENAAISWISIDAAEIQRRIDVLMDDDRDWQEFETRATDAKAQAKRQLNDALTRRETYEREQKELAVLRANAPPAPAVENRADDVINAAERKRRNQINATVGDALMVKGLTAAQATAVVGAIIKGEIPNLTIVY